MSIKVSGSNSRVPTKVSVPASNSRVATSIKTNSKITTNARVEQLSNVDITGGLEDGYTIVYDQETGKWIAQELSSSVVVASLDGGTY
jgi:hypothetical protein